MGILLLLGARGVATPLPAEQPNSPTLPVAMPIERYKTMIERSPFALATQAAPPPPVANVAGFAKDLVLTGAVRLSRSEYITIASRDQTQRFSLNTGENHEGIAVVSVAWSDAVGKTKATLKCGNEYGVIGFDEALLRSSAAPPPLEGMPLANNGQPVLPPGVTPPNPNLQPQPGAVANPGNPPPAAPSHRRRIIIRSAPPRLLEETFAEWRGF